MPKFDVPSPEDIRIMQENGLDNPHLYCVVWRDDTTIVLRNYRTRDDITIRKGDRSWQMPHAEIAQTAG